MSFSIYEAVHSDIDELGKLYDDLVDHLEATNSNYPHWKKGVYPTGEFAKEYVDKGLFVLKDNGVILGSIILNNVQEDAYNDTTWGIDAHENEVLVVRALVVCPRHIGQGISKALLDFAKGHAKSIGAKTIRLDVTEHNFPAMRLYEKCGYTYVGTVDLGLPYENLKWFKLYELIL